MNRFVKESEEGEDKYLPSLPKIGKEKIDYFQILGIMIEDKVENPKAEKESILKYTFDVENLLRGLFLEQLTKEKALPMSKNNKNLIRFLRDNIRSEDY